MFKEFSHPDTLRRPALRWLLGLLLVLLIVTVLMSIRQSLKQAQLDGVSQAPVTSGSATDASEQIQKQLSVLERSSDEPVSTAGEIVTQLEILVTAAPDTSPPTQEEVHVQLDASSQTNE